MAMGMQKASNTYVNTSSKNGTINTFANHEIILFKVEKWFQYEF